MTIYFQNQGMRKVLPQAPYQKCPWGAFTQYRSRSLCPVFRGAYLEDEKFEHNAEYGRKGYFARGSIR